ncbi:hypothetical protein Rcae01_01922 [Novipirellula caenicola]|uniref:Uncharacterized protein n=1 Tax=Novipirellula caenicola TaxID=1536901 RepID=A0ABP9VMR1_9BACT
MVDIQIALPAAGEGSYKKSFTACPAWAKFHPAETGKGGFGGLRACFWAILPS